jgi:S1-C subfamily serine protease
MTDRPRFDAEETTSSYSPPPDNRPRWAVEQGWVPPQPQTPQNWIEPTWNQAFQAPVAVPPPARPRRGATVLSLLAISLLSAGLASGGTYLLLLSTGRLNSNAAPQSAPSGVAASLAPVAQNLTITEQSAVTQAAQAVSPAVVTITSRAGAQTTDPFSLPATGIGSGVIYNAVGWIITNRHVVCGADALTVKLLDGSEYTGHEYGTDSLTDLSIVKVDGNGLPAAKVGDSSALKPGQLSIAIGSPLGTFTNSVTSGVVSAMGRDIVVNDECGNGGQKALRNLIQTDAAINPGNSGGALVDSSGAVIGINTATAGNAQGIGFAIPINIAKPIMQQAVDGQPLTRPWLGVYYQPITPAVKTAQNLPIDYGVVVKAPEGSTDPSVIAGSPAAKAGILDGDIITAINEQRIDAIHTLDEILTQFSPGDDLTITVLRKGETKELTLKLGTRPAQT